MIALPPVARRNGLGAGDRFAARRLDFIHDLLRGTDIDTVALQAAARIVDDDLCALRREQQSIGAPQPPAGAGDHGDAIVESELRHRLSSHCNRKQLRPRDGSSSASRSRDDVFKMLARTATATLDGAGPSVKSAIALAAIRTVVSIRNGA